MHGTFTATSWGRLSFGDSFYAPSFFRDAEGRPCVTFWMRGIVSPPGAGDVGSAGAHSVPYLLRMNGDVLVASPHPDIEEYRVGAPTDHVDGLAAGISWTPDDAGLLIESGGDSVVSIVRVGGEVAVAIGDSECTLPYIGDLRIILDGPVLEISSAGGLFGSAIAPQGTTLTLRSADSKTSCHALRR